MNEYEVDIVRRLRVRVNAKGPGDAIDTVNEKWSLEDYEVTNIQIVKITPNFSSSDIHEREEPL